MRYRVGALSKELALKKGMDAEMCTLIDLSARLHDIGKLRVPDSILLKPGRFTPDEREIMQKHCEHGWELIGEGGLGRLILQGLIDDFRTPLVVGSALSVLLAVVADVGLSLVQRVATPWARVASR